jgi:hypothetical protein
MGIKILTIEITDPNERRNMFVRACELLALDKDKEAKRLKIGSTAAGFNVKMDQLLKFCFDSANKGIVDGELDIPTKKLRVECEEVPAKGKAIIDNPETIKNTSVDGDDTDESSLLEGFTSVSKEEEEEDELDTGDGLFDV